MSYKTKSILLWIFAIVFTLGIATYQRMTGPTYPKKGSITIAEKEIKFKLLRSHSSSSDAIISIENKAKIFGGSILYKRYNTSDDWTEVTMAQNGDNIEGSLPAQPAAGKLMYRVFLKYGNENYALNIEPTVIRFKGDVPAFILIPHILFMFLAMLFSTRTGLEALIKGKQTFNYAMVTTITLFLGGIILGPIVQKYAFGAYWTGWPIGKDLTDNKTAVAFLFWVIATYKLFKDRDKSIMAIIAMIILLAIYLIPHSMFGSELNYESGKINTSKEL
jgi:hypothetical protein